MFTGAPANTRIVATAAIAAIAVLLALIWLVDSAARQQVQARAALASPYGPPPVRATDVVPSAGSVTPAAPATRAVAPVQHGTPASAGTARSKGLSGDAAAPRSAAAPTTRYTIVRVTRDLPITAGPGRGPRIGTLPSRSKFLGAPMSAWLREVSADGTYGRLTLPWAGSDRTGWVRIAGLPRSTTAVIVRANLSSRRLQVRIGGRIALDAPMAIGAVGSPTPVGHYWVTDPIAVPSNQPEFGSYAFGISALQPNTPAGWSGPNQMAIHGTNNPASIGTRASAGCLRVGERTLGRLRQLLRPGTPVEILP